MFNLVFDLASQERLYAVVLAALFGAFLGLRREISAQVSSKNRSFMGLRTMTLLSVLGAISTFFPDLPYLPVVMFGAIVTLTALAYANGSFNLNRIGMTTELSAFMIFWVGALVAEGMTNTAILITVLLAFNNAYKQEFASFARTMNIREWRGVLQLIIVSGLILPLLPREAIDPWGVFNPFETWFLVILISGIGFVGYFLIKYFGSRAGVPLASLLGGLVSSTAVTFAMSGKSKNQKLKGLFSAGILIALVTMQLKVFIYLLSLSKGVDLSAKIYALPIVLSLLCGAGAFFYFMTKGKERTREFSWHKGTDDKPEKDLKVESPFELVPAMKFGLLYIGLLIILHLAQKSFGDSGVYGAAVLSGALDIDSIVLASLREAGSGNLALPVAENAIAIAILCNTLIKVAYVRFLGASYLFKEVAIVVIPSVIISGLLFFFV